MVSHAATIINRFSVDLDDRTPMEKAHGTTANRNMGEFGEKIQFQPMTKYNKGNKLDVRWRYGLFMGVAKIAFGHCVLTCNKGWLVAAMGFLWDDWCGVRCISEREMVRPFFAFCLSMSGFRRSHNKPFVFESRRRSKGGDGLQSKRAYTAFGHALGPNAECTEGGGYFKVVRLCRCLRC